MPQCVLAVLVTVAATLAAADTLVDAKGDAKLIRRRPRASSSQWFGANLGLKAGELKAHKQTQHQIDGFDLEEVTSRHDWAKSHTHHKIRANAGIPILQAAKSKPSERDTWPRDLEDPVEDDGFDTPDDVVNSPGDALLQMEGNDKKPSVMRRETAMSFVDMERQRAGDCEKCKDCSDAEPNVPQNGNHSDGVWCMCKSWADWQNLKNVPGVYPGPNHACTQGCQAGNASKIAGIDCKSLNCSCDLNIYWAGESPSAFASGAASAAPKGSFF